MKKNLWRKRCLPVCLLVLALLTAGCGSTAQSTQSAAAAAPAPTAAPAIPMEQQRQILEASRDAWAFADPYDCPWYYTFTDLDHNGQLEVLAASTQGTGIFTYARYYELQPDGAGLVNLYHANVEVEGPDDWPEIVRDSLPCYYDRAADRYYYPCENVARSGPAWHYSAWYALCLKDGTAEWELLADKTEDESGDTPVLTCRDAQGNAISPADYDAAVSRRFEGMEASALALDWTMVEAPAPEQSGTAQTPALSGPAVQITKNPSSEAITVGGGTWFIAHAENAQSLRWQLLDPEGEVYTLSAAMDTLPGLELEALEGDTLAVRNAPAAMNGWGVQALFEGAGGSALTEPAYLYVGNFLEAYDGVLAGYKTAYETGNTNEAYAWEHELSPMIAYAPGLGYALKDLDKNGVPELIIAGMGGEDFSEYVVYDLYTLRDGTPVNLALSWPRMRHFIRTDSSVYWEGSGGAAYSYSAVQRVRGDALEDVETLFTDYDEAAEAVIYYYQQGHSDELPGPQSQRISEEEYNARLAGMAETIYLPPLTRFT